MLVVFVSRRPMASSVGSGDGATDPHPPGLRSGQALRRLRRAEGIELEVARGERLGLIGPNGSGKSTLVNCLSGTLRNEAGTVRFDGHRLDGMPAHQRTRLGLARSFQLPRPFGTLTLAENLRIPILYAANAGTAA